MLPPLLGFPKRERKDEGKSMTSRRSRMCRCNNITNTGKGKSYEVNVMRGRSLEVVGVKVGKELGSSGG